MAEIPFEKYQTLDMELKKRVYTVAVACVVREGMNELGQFDSAKYFTHHEEAVAYADNFAKLLGLERKVKPPTIEQPPAPRNVLFERQSTQKPIGPMSVNDLRNIPGGPA